MMFRRRRDDEAVTEVIGYVLSFAISAIFLLISLNVFHAARANTEEVVTGVELKTIADRVASRIVELGLVSQEFPEARMNVTLNIPQTLNGRLYTITGTAALITVETNDAELSATATTFKTDVISGIVVGGSVDSSNEHVRIEYVKLGSSPTITITGE